MWNGDTVRLTELPPDEPKLPYDAEVEWLESDRTQWIDTGFSFSKTSTFTADCAVYNATSETVSAFLFGATSKRGNDYAPKSNVYVAYTDAHIGFAVRDYDNTSVNTTIIWENGARHTVSLSGADRACYLDGVKLATQTSRIGDSDQHFFLFCRSLNGSSDGFAKMRLYAASASQNNTLIRDFSPVRVGSLGYLYDRANPTGGPLGNGLYGDFSDGKGGITGFPANLVGPDNPSTK